MNLREALRTMSPSLTLQRAAADEIARPDAQVRHAAELLHLASACEGAGPDLALAWFAAKGRWLQSYELSPTSRANVQPMPGATEGV